MLGANLAPAQEEDDLVGCCVSSASGYRRAASRLTASDFHQPSRARLFAACGRLDHLSGPGLDVEEERIASVTRLAGVPEAEVRRLVEDRCVQFDRAGHLARKVLAASQSRLVMRFGKDIHNAIAAGEQLADVLADVPDDIVHLLGVRR